MYLRGTLPCLSPIPPGKIVVKMENSNDNTHFSHFGVRPLGSGNEYHLTPPHDASTLRQANDQYQVGQESFTQSHDLQEKTNLHVPWAQSYPMEPTSVWGTCGLQAPLRSNKNMGYGIASTPVPRSIPEFTDYSLHLRSPYEIALATQLHHAMYNNEEVSINPQFVNRARNPVEMGCPSIQTSPTQLNPLAPGSPISNHLYHGSMDSSLDSPTSINEVSPYCSEDSPNDAAIYTYTSPSPSESPPPRTPSPLMALPASPTVIRKDISSFTDDEPIKEGQQFTEDFGVESPVTSETSSSRGKRKRGTRDTGKTVEEIDVEDDELPYAQLIYKALMSVPSRKMVLGEIYDYFRTNIPRFSKPRQKGWQNSIRHNLSMNGAFLKEERPRVPGDKTKLRGFVWVLSPIAEKEGVKSTTRFRKSISKRKKVEKAFPTPQHGTQKQKAHQSRKKRTTRPETSSESPSTTPPTSSEQSPCKNLAVESPIHVKLENPCPEHMSIDDGHCHGTVAVPVEAVDTYQYPTSHAMSDSSASHLSQEIEFFSEMEEICQFEGFDDYYYNPDEQVSFTNEVQSVNDYLLGEEASAFNEQFSLVVDRYAQH